MKSQYVLTTLDWDKMLGNIFTEGSIFTGMDGFDIDFHFKSDHQVSF